MARTISPVPDTTVCIDEAVLLRISDVARSTRRNWVKRRIITDRSDGRYYEADVIETILVALIVRATKGLEDAGRVWRATREELMSAVADPSNGTELALVLELRLLRATVTRSVNEVGEAARAFEALVLIPLAPHVQEARAAFKRFAVPPRKKPDGRRREATATAPLDRQKGASRQRG